MNVGNLVAKAELIDACGTPNQNKYVRFTSNVLRSGGIINDIACFLSAYALTVLFVGGFLQYYIDFRLHSTAAIVLAINFFLIRISRDAYSALRGQGDDLGSGTILDFGVATTLTGFTILQFGRFEDLSSTFVLSYLVLCFGLLIVSRILFRRFVWLIMRQGIIGQRVAIYGADREITTRVLELLDIERLPHINIIGYRGRSPHACRDRHDRALPIPRRVRGTAGSCPRRECSISSSSRSPWSARSVSTRSSSSFFCRGSIDVCFMPREFLVLRDRYRVNYIGSLPVLNVWQQPVRTSTAFSRAFRTARWRCSASSSCRRC